MNPNQIKSALNTKLPDDIYINYCRVINKEFNARFSAKKREYNYYIINHYSTSKRLYSWFCKWEIENKKLFQCSDILIGENDFSLFSKASSETENKKCIIYKSKWILENDQYFFLIQGNRFLQHMVRLLVGTMVEVGRGRIPIDDFKKMIKCSRTNFCSVRAPAKGLFLNKVYYD